MRSNQHTITQSQSSPARSRRRHSRLSRERGMAFVATMMILLMCMAILLVGVVAEDTSGNTSSATGNGLMGTINNSVTSANARMNSAAAFDLAESGLEYTSEWLSEQGTPPSSNTSFCPSGWGQFPSSSSSSHCAPISLGAGTFSVIMYPLSTNQNGNGFGYLIESQGVADGATVTLQAYITQTNFGHYAYFSNYDDPAGWWVVGMNSFNGPMHSNDTNNNGQTFTPTNILWYNNKTTNPMFQYLGSDAYTVSAPTIDWNVNNIGTSGSPSSATNWSNIAAGGSSTVHTGTSIIPLPTSSYEQENASLDQTGTPNPPSTVGVTIPNSNSATTGGIYINPGSVSGDVVNQITFSVQNNTTQVITVQQTNEAIAGSNKNETTTITINQSADTTTVSTVTGSGGPTNTTTASYTGTTNGVVFCNGNVGTNTDSTSAAGGISGTIADSYTNSSGVTNYWGVTVATPSNDNANIDGSIVYNTPPGSANFATNAGSFGLVTDTASVTSLNSSGQNLRTVDIDGAVLAYNTFWLPNYTETPTGTFNLYGSYIAGNAGFFGQVTLSGSLVSGLAESYDYDSRLGVHPPPFFPTTGSTYTFQSWKMVPTTLQTP